MRISPPLLVVSLCALALAGTGCIGVGKWQSIGPDSPPPSVRLSDDSVSAIGPPALSPLPAIPVRKKLRWCCAFGTGLRVKVGHLPLPFIRVGSMLDVDDLGPHRYDGATAAIDDERRNAFPKGEHNGLIYTCRGGFIDTAHVRETVDWAAFFVSEFDRALEAGAEIELGDEGGERRMILRPVPPERIAPGGRDELIVAMSQWMAHQVMAWHEFAQWYGWSILALYPETVSGFSPEDIYSNSVGLRLLDELNIRHDLASEKIYNRHIDDALAHALRELGAVPKKLSAEAIHAIDKVWWDSGERLPEKGLVRRRYMNVGSEIEPWLLPERFASPGLRDRLTNACGADPEPRVVRIPQSLDGLVFEDYLTLEIRPGKRLAEQPVFRALDRPVTQADFADLLSAIRAENRSEFGQRADRPD